MKENNRSNNNNNHHHHIPLRSNLATVQIVIALTDLSHVSLLIYCVGPMKIERNDGPDGYI
jgi:hypothetical protein